MESALYERLNSLNEMRDACSEVIKTLLLYKGEIDGEVDRYLNFISKQKSRFEGDAYAIQRTISVVGNEKRKKDWRETVLMRDKFTCQRCGSRDSVTCHHIIPKSVCGDDMRWDPNNGVVLCYECHTKWHMLGKDGVNQFIRWLSNAR